MESEVLTAQTAPDDTMFYAVAVKTVLHSPALSLCCFLPFVSPYTLYFALKLPHMPPVWGLGAAAQIVTSLRPACHGAMSLPHTPVPEATLHDRKLV